MKNQTKLFSILMVVLLSILACSTPSPTPNSNSNLSQTQTALAMTMTAMNSKPVETPFNPVIPTPTDTQQLIVFPTATNTQQVIVIPTATNTLQVIPTSTSSTLSDQQIKEKIASANILIYEDIVEDPYYIAFVSKAATTVGGNRTYVGDAVGTLMQQLNSSTAWDLIIVASEARGAISGDFWTAIKAQVDKGVALVTEIWYLDKINNGKITPLLDECGINVQKNWERYSGFNPINYDMYWIDSNNPVFNTPNKVGNFTYTVPDPWMGDAGDLMKLTPGSTSKILASHVSGDSTDNGLLTSCLEGRVLFQTFSSHDYPSNPMIALWVNYITYALTNHFKAIH